MKTVMTVFGTRPEAIKLAPVIRSLAQKADKFRHVVCVTGQHREMLDQVLDLFHIRPDYDLDVMRRDQTLSHTTSSILSALEPVLYKEKPDWVLVQGDTTTAMAASLGAFYHRLNIGHVEAGLRTKNKYHPFPEEINRKIVACVADLHFAPTSTAAENLRREGVSEDDILVTGNTVIDAVREVASRPTNAEGAPVDESDLTGKRLILVTAHRRENLGDGIQEICAAIKEIATSHPDVQIAFPVHLNPKVQKPVYEALSSVPNIALLGPLDYRSLVWLMQRSFLVLTDSGGIQEEAPGLGKPVLVMRSTTERPEGVTAGVVKLVGTSRQRIVSETCRLLEDDREYLSMALAVNPYGDGRAAERIVASLM